MKLFKLQIIAAISGMLLLLVSCNKDLEQLSEAPVIPQSGPTLNEVLGSIPGDSLYYKMVSRLGLNAVLADSTKYHTLFVPSNEAIKPVLSVIAAQGGVALPVGAPDAAFSAFISAMPLPVIGGLVSYNTVPQKLPSASIGNSFPNLIYPTILNPSPSTEILLGPVLRLAVYPSTTNGAWLNNVPIVAVDAMASNGVIHHTASMNTPPQKYLWDRISNDPQLTYLKAAIERADSGQTTGTLQGYLSTFGPDFTVFAPVDSAFRVALTSLIAQGLISQGISAPVAVQLATNLASTSGVFSNPVLSGTLTPQLVRGVLVYHVLGARAYTNNFSTTEKAYPTLLNTLLATHPGLKIKVTPNTPPNPFMASMTVKDVYNNSPAANVYINRIPLLPDPLGSSDQSYVNGVLHKIDAVLLPQ